jgi:hypothetical protein
MLFLAFPSELKSENAYERDEFVHICFRPFFQPAARLV